MAGSCWRTSGRQCPLNLAFLLKYKWAGQKLDGSKSRISSACQVFDWQACQPTIRSPPKLLRSCLDGIQESMGKICTVGTGVYHGIAALVYLTTHNQVITLGTSKHSKLFNQPLLFSRAFMSCYVTVLNLSCTGSERRVTDASTTLNVNKYYLHIAAIARSLQGNK